MSVILIKMHFNLMTFAINNLPGIFPLYLFNIIIICFIWWYNYYNVKCRRATAASEHHKFYLWRRQRCPAGHRGERKHQSAEDQVISINSFPEWEIYQGERKRERGTHNCRAIERALKRFKTCFCKCMHVNKTKQKQDGWMATSIMPLDLRL